MEGLLRDNKRNEEEDRLTAALAITELSEGFHLLEGPDSTSCSASFDKKNVKLENNTGFDQTFGDNKPYIKSSRLSPLDLTLKKHSIDDYHQLNAIKNEEIDDIKYEKSILSYVVTPSTSLHDVVVTKPENKDTAFSSFESTIAISRPHNSILIHYPPLNIISLGSNNLFLMEKKNLSQSYNMSYKTDNMTMRYQVPNLDVFNKPDASAISQDFSSKRFLKTPQGLSSISDFYRSRDGKNDKKWMRKNSRDFKTALKHECPEPRQEKPQPTFNESNPQRTFNKHHPQPTSHESHPQSFPSGLSSIKNFYKTHSKMRLNSSTIIKDLIFQDKDVLRGCYDNNSQLGITQSEPCSPMVPLPVYLEEEEEDGTTSCVDHMASVKSEPLRIMKRKLPRLRTKEFPKMSKDIDAYSLEKPLTSSGAFRSNPHFQELLRIPLKVLELSSHDDSSGKIKRNCNKRFMQLKKSVEPRTINQRKYTMVGFGRNKVRMQLDTGADVTVINTKTWKRIGSPVLVKSNIRLGAANGTLIKTEGRFESKFTCGGHTGHGSCYVTKNVDQLMGIDWICQIQPVEKAFNAICCKVEQKPSEVGKRLTGKLEGCPGVFKRERGRGDKKAQLGVIQRLRPKDVILNLPVIRVDFRRRTEQDPKLKTEVLAVRVGQHKKTSRNKRRARRLEGTDNRTCQKCRGEGAKAKVLQGCLKNKQATLYSSVPGQKTFVDKRKYAHLQEVKMEDQINRKQGACRSKCTEGLPVRSKRTQQ